MVIISKTIITEFLEREPQSGNALLSWYRIVKAADWAKFSDVRQTFNSVDAVGNDRFVFNIKGNEYRLVTIIHFNIRTLYILFIGTHTEYDKINASTVEYKN